MRLSERGVLLRWLRHRGNHVLAVVEESDLTRPSSVMPCWISCKSVLSPVELSAIVPVLLMMPSSGNMAPVADGHAAGIVGDGRLIEHEVACGKRRRIYALQRDRFAGANLIVALRLPTRRRSAIACSRLSTRAARVRRLSTTSG